MIEEEMRQHLDRCTHELYLWECEGQVVLLELRTTLLREQAREAVAAGKITEADVENVRSKWNAFKQEFAAVKAAGVISTKASRAACNDAWAELSSALRSTQEKAGLAADH